MNKVILKNVDDNALRNPRACANMKCRNYTHTLATLVVNEYQDEFVVPICTSCLKIYKGA